MTSPVYLRFGRIAASQRTDAYGPKAAVSNRSKRASYSITSSARASRLGETSRRNVFAVSNDDEFKGGRLLEWQVGWRYPLRIRST